MPKGVCLTLFGVNPGSAGLNSDSDLVANVGFIENASLNQFRFAEIFLPKPKNILSYFPGQIPARALSGEQSAGFTNYSAVHVFEYEVRGDFAQISLSGDGFSWSCLGKVELDDGSLMSDLHLLNEPELSAIATAEHAKQEFNRGIELYPIKLNDEEALPFPGLPGPVPLPDGMLFEELLPLSLRPSKVFNLLQPLRKQTRDGGIEAVGGSHFCGTVHARVAG